MKATAANEWILLHSVSVDGYIEVVKLLLDRGADLKATRADGWRGEYTIRFGA